MDIGYCNIRATTCSHRRVVILRSSSKTSRVRSNGQREPEVASTRRWPFGLEPPLPREATTGSSRPPDVPMDSSWLTRSRPRHGARWCWRRLPSSWADWSSSSCCRRRCWAARVPRSGTLRETSRPGSSPSSAVEIAHGTTARSIAPPDRVASRRSASATRPAFSARRVAGRDRRHAYATSGGSPS